MKNILLVLFLFVATTSQAQKLKKSEKAIVEDLKSTIYYLADDKLEGRRTGTEGEVLAANYLVKQFTKIGLTSKGENGTFLQEFPVHEGRKILEGTELTIDKQKIDSSLFFPLTFSSEGSIRDMLSPDIHESGVAWMYDVRPLLEKNANNPHFNPEEKLKETASSLINKGATGIIFYSSGAADPQLKFNGKSKQDRLGIPIVYIKKGADEKLIHPNGDFLNISLNIHTGEVPRTGRNVIGYLDNQAEYTVIIGAHFDHLGYGEDNNSLWTGAPAIHNGADDNASGTALVIEMAKQLQKSKFKSFNYLFILFSGEELGLYGSKYFTEHPTIPLEKVTYMVNADMVGRLHPDTKTITLGGYGTSPFWSNLPEQTKYIHVKFDSSGIGPSDHTSFYLKDIPVLFFFTGIHTDYHKPSDKADKINYEGELRVIQYLLDVVKLTEKAGKLPFAKTREPKSGDTPEFSVTLGIMPDYTYNGQGLRVDGVITGKVADEAGIKAGDIITKIGDVSVSDIYKYMEGLSKFKKGDETTVEFTRENKTQTKHIKF